MHEAPLLLSDVRCFSLEKQFPHMLNQHGFPEEYLLHDGTTEGCQLPKSGVVCRHFLKHTSDWLFRRAVVSLCVHCQ